MNKLLGKVPGIEIGVVVGSDAVGNVRVEMSDGSILTATPLWTGVDVAWSECIGLRAAVASTVGSSSIPLLVGLLDRTKSLSTLGGRRVEKMQHIQAKDELILKCGKSKISLRADGRVTILGGYVLSR